jgi:hypothetical protein
VVTLTNPGLQKNAVGETIYLALSARDSAGTPVTYSEVNFGIGRTLSRTTLPPGLTLDPNTGVISGTIAPAAAYSPHGYLVSIKVSDTVDPNESVIQRFGWTITTSGKVTVTLTDPGNQTNADGDSVTLHLSATDSAGRPLHYRATNLPAGLTLDPKTGTISGIIIVGASQHPNNPFQVTVVAFDSQNVAASQSFQWTINRSWLTVVSGDLAELYQEYQSYLASGQTTPFVPKHKYLNVSNGQVPVYVFVANSASVPSVTSELTNLGATNVSNEDVQVTATVPILQLPAIGTLTNILSVLAVNRPPIPR